METRWLRPNACVFFFFLMLRIWPFMHFSVDITEAPHFSPLFQLNLEAHWATIQQTAHEHSLKTWSGIIISKNICPADTVAQQEELAGCQLQPWNPTVVIKKLIKWVTFSPEKKAHGEPVVSTIASSSTGLSERTWRPFRPGLGASRYKKLKPSSPLFLQAAFEGQPLRIRWGGHLRCKGNKSESGFLQHRDQSLGFIHLAGRWQDTTAHVLYVLMKCHRTLGKHCYNVNSSLSWKGRCFASIAVFQAIS